MRALRVVLDPPVLEQHLRLEQAVELLDGQELVAQPAVERLDVWVLPRRVGLDVASDRPPRGRSGEARGFVRRVAERRAGTEVSDRLLQSLIAKHDWDSFAVHPNAVTAALALSACDDESGDNALSIALNVAVATSLASAFLMLVVEERGPADADLSSARALLERAALLIRV